MSKAALLEVFVGILFSQIVPVVSHDPSAVNTSSTSIRVNLTSDWNLTSVWGYHIAYWPLNAREPRNDSHRNVQLLCVAVNATELQNLSIYTTYVISIHLFDRDNLSAQGVNLTVSTDEDVPGGPPRSLTAFAINSTSVNVSWDEVPLPDRHGLITEYRLLFTDTIRVDGKYISKEENVTGGQRTGVVTELGKFRNYSIKIEAFTSKGGSGFSDVLASVRTKEDVPSEPPRGIIVVDRNSSSITIEVYSPLKNDLNGIHRGYQIRYQEAASGNITVLNISDSKAKGRRNETVVFLGLKPYTYYSVEAAAFTVGLGPFSAPKYIISGESVPSSPPPNVTAFNTSSTSIRVTWQGIPMGRIHGRLLGYSITYRGVGNHIELVKLVSTCFEHANLTRLSKYTRYEISVAGFTREGHGNRSNVSCTTDEDVPSGAPTNVAFTQLPKRGATITWGPVPENETHGIITHYGVFVFTEGGQSFVNFTRNHSLVLGNLEPFSNYSVKVQAFTRKGGGPNSSFVKFSTPDAAPSYVPTNLTVIAKNSTAISVAWGSPDLVAHPRIVKFIVEYNTSHTSTTEEVSKGTNQAYLLDLLPYTNYTIRVAASSTLLGNYSPPKLCTTDESVPTGSPRNVRVVFGSRGPYGATITWSPLRRNESHGVIRGYLVSVIGQPRINTSEITVAVRGLTLRTNYSVYVEAFNSKGRGPRSEAVNFSTTNTEPTFIPENVTATSQSNSTILVNWSANASLERKEDIRWYEIRYQQSMPVSNESVLLVSAESQPAEICNLRPFTRYTVRVAAFNDLPGNFSEAVFVRTQEGVPTGPPLNVFVVPAKTHASIKWNNVSQDKANGKILGYIIRITGANGALFSKENTSMQEFRANDLNAYNNYSLYVQAYTSKGEGPESPRFDFETLDEEPKFTPDNVTAIRSNTSKTTIVVRWDGATERERGAQRIKEYLVRYEAPGGSVKEKRVLATDSTIHLSGLRLYTRYTIQIAAVTHSNTPGNFSKVFHITTPEGVPSSYPINFGLSSLDSTSIRASWDPVPKDNRNGEIIGYRLKYRKISNFLSRKRREASDNQEPWDGEVEVHPDNNLRIFTALDKAATYLVRLQAFTRVGEGNFTELTVTTGESVPTGEPQQLTASKWTNTDRIRVTWRPVPKGQRNGEIRKYHVQWQAFKIGDIRVYDQPIGTDEVKAPIMNYMIRNLQPYVVYKIEVRAATSVEGQGPAADTYGETCRCKQRLTTNWHRYAPYVDSPTEPDKREIIPSILLEMVQHCCDVCQEHNRSAVDFSSDGLQRKAEKKSAKELLNSSDVTDFSFPVHGHRDQERFKGGLGYAPLVETSGVAFIVVRNTSKTKEDMFKSIMRNIPLMLVPIVTAFMAGAVVWALEARQNSNHFPKSFLGGVWEGAWWSFVTMTTVGYGDRCPLGWAGRFFAIFWIVVGLIIVAMAMATITTALTTITLDSTPKIYGSKAATIHESPEYYLGKRRNALVDLGRQYQTLKEISDDLAQKAIPAALVDAYAAGAESEHFSKSFLQVAQVVDYKTAYGIVLGGDAKRLRRCFSVYVHENRGSIFERIERNVQAVKVPEGDVSEAVSTGLFDSNSENFQLSLTYTLVLLGGFVALGLVHSLVRRFRERAKVHDSVIRTDVKAKEELRGLVEEFYSRVKAMKVDVQSKHRRELKKLLNWRKEDSKRSVKLFACRRVASMESKPPSMSSDMELVSI